MVEFFSKDFAGMFFRLVNYYIPKGPFYNIFTDICHTFNPKKKEVCEW